MNINIGSMMNINQLWISFISNAPSIDPSCIRYWEKIDWFVSEDSSDCFRIKAQYKFGVDDKSMQTWTEPFGTSRNFFKWISTAKKFLRSNEFRVESFYNKTNNSFSIIFKLYK